MSRLRPADCEIDRAMESLTSRSLPAVSRAAE
jgi:hypothetical protein